jgi:hypothetical protein
MIQNLRVSGCFRPIKRRFVILLEETEEGTALCERWGMLFNLDLPRQEAERLLLTYLNIESLYDAIYHSALLHTNNTLPINELISEVEHQLL